ncbi:hypothetical protein Bca4012_008503 [Brassica carinata]
MIRQRPMAVDLKSVTALCTVVILLFRGGAATEDETEFHGDYSKLSGIIIPGFASTQLRAWSMLDCPYTPLDFNPLDLVWLDTTKLITDGLLQLLSAVNCWFKCMALDPYNQTDHPECKSRPDSGLSAITELDPGYITGPLSTVWKEWLKWCVEFGIEANAIVAVPYDWRLSPTKLEERDLYFHKLKLTFETALKLRGGPSIVFAHSMGNNVFRYFLEWLRLEIAPKQYLGWLDQHIHAYFAVGAPLLGSVDAIKSALSGVTFGLPISEGTARLLSNSFASSLWLMPFSKNCKGDNTYWTHFSGGAAKKDKRVYHCTDEEYQSKYSGWPTNIINIEIPSTNSRDAYPSVTEAVQANMTTMECGLPTLLSFTARELADGSLFKAIKDYDPDSKRMLHQLKKSSYQMYICPMLLNVGYYFAPSGKPYPDNWIITDIIYETEGSLLSRNRRLAHNSSRCNICRSGTVVDGNAGPITGDETVPYHSLSWCKNWLGPKVNITMAPQPEHDGSDVHVELNVEHEHGSDIIANMTKAPRVKYITFYEDSESIPGKRTAVWELDKTNHRNIVRSPVLMRELWLQMWHDIQPGAKSKFVTKAKRGPLRDADCYWDYGKACCAWQEYCEYRYSFGDVHLGQSCRLRNTSANMLLQYI